MTDEERTLLERAARAAWRAGMEILRAPDGSWRDCTGRDPAMNIFAAPMWRPRDDDGDAFRLAVALRIDVLHLLPCGVEAGGSGYVSHYENGALAATRRAIFLAAAQMGVDHG